MAGQSGNHRFARGSVLVWAERLFGLTLRGKRWSANTIIVPGVAIVHLHGESSRLTMRESSSGSHLGHELQVAEAVVERDRRVTASWPADRVAFMIKKRCCYYRFCSKRCSRSPEKKGNLSSAKRRALEDEKVWLVPRRWIAESPRRQDAERVPSSQSNERYRRQTSGARASKEGFGEGRGEKGSRIKVCTTSSYD